MSTSTSTSTSASAELEFDDSVQQLKQVNVIFFFILGTLGFVLFGISVYGGKVNRLLLRENRKRKLLYQYQLACVFFSSLTALGTGLCYISSLFEDDLQTYELQFDYENNTNVQLLGILNYQSNCDVLSKICPYSYLLANLFTYLFLVERAKGANSFGAGNRLLTNIINLLMFGICVVFLAMCIIPFVYDLIFKSAVLNQSVCTIFISQFISVIFWLGDTGISFVLLAVFVIPLYSTTKSMEQSIQQMSHEKRSQNKFAQSQAYLKRTMIKNLVISSITITTTFITLAITTLWQYATDDESVVANRYMYINTLVMLDLTINLTGILVLNKNWSPWHYRRKQRLLQQIETQVENSSYDTISFSKLSNANSNSGSRTSNTAVEDKDKTKAMAGSDSQV